MSQALSTRRSAVAKPDARRLDQRAIDALGITRLATDSRRVRSGDTFMAYPGEAQDGRRFIAQAIANGARSVLWERRGFRWKPAWRVDNFGVANLRARAGHIAGHAYGHPSARMWMVGVTGTNGKTTCSQWIARALDASGLRSAVIGTLGYGRAAGGRLRPLVNTTPDAVWLQERLAAFVRAGVKAVSMEVSSIGLDQDRVAGIDFDVALFTNLTRDHLDYHRDMRRYKAAKARLFECASLTHAVVNLDDEFGRTLARRIERPGLNIIGYGFEAHRNGARRSARVAGRNLVADARGVHFDVATPWGSARVASPVLGGFNASNLLGTLAVLLASGMGLRKAVAALARLTPVTGRMQTVGGGVQPLVVVDYAHTPDALEKALLTLRDLMATGKAQRTSQAGAGALSRGRARARRAPQLICVFGCGGERDRGKRPLMGSIAAQLADRVIVTSDNPRGEEPRAIADDIMAGIARGGEMQLDRRRAIRGAVGGARRGDVVLIAGKGHENYQEARGARRPFSDSAVARSALARWAAGEAP